jgi:hypothetical protein
LRTEFLNHQTVSLSNDFLAILDRVDRRGILFFCCNEEYLVIHFVDLATGKPLEVQIKNPIDIVEICINQYSFPR